VVAELSTLGTDLSAGERGFLAWMAPRGIVAASTAATFSRGLSDAGIPGADKIMPTAFVVIVATVALYGLTAQPVARRLHVVRPARSRPLLVGGTPWVVDFARARREAGVEVLLWAGRGSERERVAAAGLELAEGELAAVTEPGAEELGLTSVFMLGDDDEFNALASTLIDGEGLTVYHLGRECDMADGRLLRASTFATKLSQTCPCGAEATKTLADRVHDCPACGLTGDRDLVSALLAALVRLTDPDDPATARLDRSLARHTQILFASGLQEALSSRPQLGARPVRGRTHAAARHTPYRGSGPLLGETPPAGISRSRMRPDPRPRGTRPTPDRLIARSRRPRNGSWSDGICSSRDDS
jgi:hypothetical protein